MAERKTILYNRTSVKLRVYSENESQTYAEPRYVGTCGRAIRSHGICLSVPPYSYDAKDEPDEYYVLPSGDLIGQPVVRYDVPVYLATPSGGVWNYKTGGITGYITKKPLKEPGAIPISFQRAVPRATEFSDPNDPNYGLVLDGDIVYLKSELNSRWYSEQITLFRPYKAATTRTTIHGKTPSPPPPEDVKEEAVGGFLVCDGKGEPVRFVVECVATNSDGLIENADELLYQANEYLDPDADLLERIPESPWVEAKMVDEVESQSMYSTTLALPAASPRLGPGYSSPAQRRPSHNLSASGTMLSPPSPAQPPRRIQTSPHYEYKVSSSDGTAGWNATSSASGFIPPPSQGSTLLAPPQSALNPATPLLPPSTAAPSASILWSTAPSPAPVSAFPASPAPPAAELSLQISKSGQLSASSSSQGSCTPLTAAPSNSCDSSDNLQAIAGEPVAEPHVRRLPAIRERLQSFFPRYQSFATQPYPPIEQLRKSAIASASVSVLLASVAFSGRFNLPGQIVFTMGALFFAAVAGWCFGCIRGASAVERLDFDLTNMKLDNEELQNRVTELTDELASTRRRVASTPIPGRPNALQLPARTLTQPIFPGPTVTEPWLPIFEIRVERLRESPYFSSAEQPRINDPIFPPASSDPRLPYSYHHFYHNAHTLINIVRQKKYDELFAAFKQRAEQLMGPGGELCVPGARMTLRQLAKATADFPERYRLAEPGNEKFARERWVDTKRWRMSPPLYVDLILLKPYPRFNEVRSMSGHFLHKYAKDGTMVYYERPALLDLDKMRQRGITEEDLIMHYWHATEFQWKLLDSHPMGLLTSILDLKDLGFGVVSGEANAFIKRVSKLLQEHSPVRTKRILIINAPGWFNMLWRAFSGLLHERTRKKIKVASSKEAKELLLEFIDPDALPAEYGGTCQCEGGCDLGSESELRYRAFVKAINDLHGVESVPLPTR